jgi:hypothetical protein
MQERSCGHHFCKQGTTTFITFHHTGDCNVPGVVVLFVCSVLENSAHTFTQSHNDIHFIHSLSPPHKTQHNKDDVDG